AGPADPPAAVDPGPVARLAGEPGGVASVRLTANAVPRHGGGARAPPGFFLPIRTELRGAPPAWPPTAGPARVVAAPQAPRAPSAGCTTNCENPGRRIPCGAVPRSACRSIAAASPAVDDEAPARRTARNPPCRSAYRAVRPC